MATCLWCIVLKTDEEVVATLQDYSAGRLSLPEAQSANEDFIHCGDCVDRYHRARDQVPELHKRLWELETTRLLSLFRKFLEVNLDDADVFLVDNGREHPMLEFSLEEFIVNLRIPLMEVLKYPYLLCHRDLCEVVLNVMCKMQDMGNPVPLTDKYPGIYLLMVHPNEMVRRWAITTARSLGRIKRDSYYYLEEIFSCLFYIIELGISLDCPIPDDNFYSGKIQRLPSHLYDARNEKNYWLGVCMALMQLDCQAMDSLFMGPGKHADILQCIVNTLSDSRGDGDKASDPFWPALQCFMVILDRLGSKTWSHIDPDVAFCAVTRAGSYVHEIRNIRRNTTGTRVKLEQDGDGDDMVSCSQMVYDCYSVEQRNEWSGWMSDSSGVFEEMSCLVNILQSEMGQNMRVYGSTFLWFLPFVRSVMELAEIGVIDIVDLIIRYLYDEINKDVLSGRAHTCDKVTEFFVRVLVDIIELHLSKDCMRLLYLYTHDWVTVVVQTATLSDETCVTRVPERKCGSYRVTSTTSRASVAGVGAMSRACMKLILALLKKRRRMGMDSDSSRFLDLLNIHMREVPPRGWNLTESECDDLQNCLVKLVKAGSNGSAVVPALPATSADPPGSVVSHLNSTSPRSPQQPRYKDAETGTRDAPNVKDEPPWECAEKEDVCDGLEIRAKKEPRSPVLISEFKVELKPDFVKIQEIRSRLSDSQNLSKIQAIAMRKSGSGQGLNECNNQKDAGQISRLAHAGTSRPTAAGSAKPSKCSKKWNEDSDEDEPFHIRRKCLKPIRGLSSVSEEDVCDSRNLSVQPSGSKKEDADSKIIVISDDEADKSDTKGGNGPGNLVLNESPGRDYDDLSESQVFEFETQENIASAWGDLFSDGPVKTKKRKCSPTDEASTSGDVELESVWSNETQPVPDENIERACRQVEDQISHQQQLRQPLASSNLLPARRRSSPEKQDDFMQPKPVISKSPTKKSDKKGKQRQNKTTVLIEPLNQKRKRKSHTASAHELEKVPSSTTPPSESPVAASCSVSSSVPSVTCHLSTPAIVPPKKVRKSVEPESVAERLGLKKRERKAFELSQRSLDSLGELRSYGQNVHVEPQPKSKRIHADKKAQQKLPVKGRKKLLASQEMQYYRQSRGKCQRTAASSTAPPRVAEKAGPGASSTPSRPESTEEPVWGEEEEEDEEDDYAFLPCSQPDPDQKTDSKNAGKQVKIGIPSELCKSTSEEIDGSVCEETGRLQNRNGTDGGASSTAEGARRASEQVGFNDDDEWRYLTQNEPTDMELCSQMEYCEDYLYTQRDPVDMDLDQDGQPDTTWSATGEPPTTLSTSVSERTLPAAPTQSSLNDHLFLKPGLPPVTHRKAKLSTTKIYAAVSRSASLAIEMEKASKPLPAASVAKAKVKVAHLPSSVPPLPTPAKATPTPQPPPNQPIPPKPPTSSLGQTAKPVPSRPTLLQVTKDVCHRPFLHPSSHIPKPLHPLSSNITRPSQPRSYNAYSRPEAPVSAPAATVDHTQNIDQSFLTQAILKWEYRLFDNYKTFGAPDDLHPLPLKKVPTAFSSYQQYFNSLFPLLFLNAFEEMASEWHSGSRIELDLKVQGIEYSNRIASASFTACLNSQQDMKQLYPKEEDLVFLWLPENTGAYATDETESHEPLPYLGFVSRSMVYSNGGGQPSTLNLTIQTRGNVSSVNAQPVRCKVIGSLVSTLREFRALCQLKHGVMKRVLLTPHPAFFTPCQEDLVHLRLPHDNEDDYNEDQEKAIGCGVAMVKRSQKQPKILLIHGPPGTGKSKTIVGLLNKLLFHDGTSTSVNRHGNSCQARILVCTPSNAAIDNLMKKMILVFKERSTNPQGNCGDINLVRLGNEKTISPVLHPFSLDSQTKAKTLKAQQYSDSEIQRQKEELDQRIENISRQCTKTQKKSPEFQQLMTHKVHYLKEREKLGRQLKESRSKRQEVQTRLLQDANVICCTLSTSGSSVLESAFRRLGREPFSCVVVDEAGQAKETETLIPLLHRCPSLILVGDPEQLPPTVISQKAKELGYDCSLMGRLMRSLAQTHPQQDPSVFFSVQYRMHPDICHFPSAYIYNKRLDTDRKMAQKRLSFEWPFEPYRIFDVMDGCESRERKDSFCNLKEVRLVLLLVRLIMEKQPVRVGVITPYSAQKRRLQEALKELGPSSRHPAVEVNTVDGFQGRDMDCVIVSCVRASSEKGSIGFVGNRQRMNVTITRAKFSLFILGHLRTLKEQSDWGALIDDAARRCTIIKTQERDFSNAARKILKRDLLSRSLSYLPTDGPGPVSPDGSACPEDASSHRWEAVPVRVPRSHRASEPPPSHPPTVSLSTGSQLRRVSPPPTDTDVPRDPRLCRRLSDPRLVEVQPNREGRGLQDPRQPVREPEREGRGLQDPRQPVREPEREGRGLQDPRRPVREPERERRGLQNPRQPVREPDRERRGTRDPRQPVRESDQRQRPDREDPHVRSTHSSRRHRR